MNQSIPSLKLSPSLKLTQSLQLTPQLQLAIKLLQMNNFELKELISEEMLENPFLEVEWNEGDLKNAAAEEQQPVIQEQTTDSTAEFSGSREGFNGNNRDEYKNATDLENLSGSRNSGIPDSQTLSQVLIEQVNSLTGITGSIKKEMLFLIGNLDDNGFLSQDIRELADVYNGSPDNLQHALELLQSLDPAGVGAKGPVDSLIIQLRRTGKAGSLEEKLLTIYPEQVEKQKFDLIAKNEKIILADIQKALSSIKRLNPFPGRFFVQEYDAPIQPELVVNKVDDEYVTVFLDEDLPDLHLSPFYLTMTQDTENKKVKFLKDKYRSAEWLLKCIEQRKRTIYKVADFIVKHQSEFFNNGPQSLKPLTLKDVSSGVSLHESTVSRAVNGKHIVTPRGTFELKELFSNAIPKNQTYRNTGDEAASESSEAVAEQIKLIIKSESPDSPYSDQEITDKLQSNGIKMARRTVAKYREELGLPGSAQRKRQRIFSQITGS